MTELRVHRLGAYASSILVLGVAGLLALWLAPELRPGSGAWLAFPPPVGEAVGPAVLMVAGGILVAYGFRALSWRFGWRETEAVRAIMPVTSREKGVFALLAVTAGICEEIVFRGFLPSLLIPWVGAYFLAALPAAVAFGVLHSYQGVHGMVRTGIIGLVLAAGVAWTGSLWPSIFAHGALDLIFGLLLSKSLLRA